MKRYLFIYLVLLIYSCGDNFDIRLKVKNATSSDLYIIEYDTNSLLDYPNEILNLGNDFYAKDSTGHIGKFGAGKNIWPNYIKKARNKKLNLFIISADTVNTYPKDTIIKYKKYNKVLSYSLKKLDKMSWKIEIK